jgi:hypothetical protein
LFQRSAPREHAVWDKMMRGLSTRKLWSGGEGISRGLWGGEVGGREQLPELMELPLGELHLCTVQVNTGHIGLATFIAG